MELDLFLDFDYSIKIKKIPSPYVDRCASANRFDRELIPSEVCKDCTNPM